MSDAIARNMIVSNAGLKKNIFVKAGAGSGKTSMLVNRLVALIEAGVDIRLICAITFTVNAAAEFKERLSQTLKRRMNGIPVPEDSYPGGLGIPNDKHKQELDRKALMDIDLCFAGTIDAFCNLILSEYPLDAHIPSSSMVIQDDEASIIYKVEYTRITREHPTDDLVRAFNYMFKDPAKIFSNEINSMLDATLLDIQYEPITNTLDGYLHEFKTKYEAVIKKAINEIIANEPNLKDNDTVRKAYTEFKDSAHKLVKNDWTMREVFDLRKVHSRISGIRFVKGSTPCALFLALKPTSDVTYDPNSIFEEFYNKSYQLAHSYYVEFYKYCANQIRSKLRELGKLTFSEYLVVFREVVNEDMTKPGMPLINHIRKRYQHFLIDESQDTSPFQYDLFLKLCSKKPAKTYKNCDLIPGSLFIVGDPKQSIYRFRGADIRSYEDVESLFNNPDNIVLELTDNYRSTSSLCDYFNKEFNGMPGYSPISNAAKNDSNQFQGLYYYSNYVDIIKDLVGNPKHMIKTKDEAALHTIRYKDIMVLTFGKPATAVISNELTNENIPNYVEGLNIFTDSDIVHAAYAMYAYLVDPITYRDNLYASPLFNFDKKEILSNNPIVLNKDEKDLMNLLDSYKNITNPVNLFRKIIEDARLFRFVSNKRMDYLYFILNQLSSAYASGMISNVNDGLTFLDNMIKNNAEKTAQLVNKPNAVYIANVHKVKGLEAPIVILYKSGKANRGNTTSLDYVNNKSYCLRFGEEEFAGTKYYDFDLSKQYETVEDEEKRQKENEFRRLQYVAATRARNALLIHSEKTSNVWFSLTSNHKFVEYAVDQNRIDNFSISSKHLLDKDIYPNPVSLSFDQNPTHEIVLPSKLVVSHDGDYDSSKVNDAAKLDAAERGTLVHALMEIYVNSGLTMSKDKAVATTLSNFGYDASSPYKAMLDKVMDTILSGGYLQESGSKEDIVAILKGASERYCEVPFSYQEGDKIYNGSIDLLYKVGEEYFIVDYKTNYDTEGLEDKYAKQLKAYQDAIKKIKGIDATARIYHIDIK